MNETSTAILYVDDDWANRVVFEQSFGKELDVATAGSGPEALQCLESRMFAVVVTDQRMPGMSGLDLLSELKLRAPDVVRMVVTAHSDIEPILRAVNEGLVARYIVKPWNRTHLAELLRWGLAAHRMGRERATLQQRLIQTERLATLGTIASAVVHDLKQPLSYVRYNVQRLAQLGHAVPALRKLLQTRADDVEETDRQLLLELTDELATLAEQMGSGTKLMSQLLENMQRWAVPQRADESGSSDPLSAIRFALSACGSLRGGGPQLVYDGPESLPRVSMDGASLTRVLINLIGNAIQALDGRDGQVRLCAKVREQKVELRVEDDGPGMAEEVLQNAGSLFFTTRAEGTGIGLHQCRRLVAMAGSQLRIESTPGQGTSVFFDLSALD